jgi:hypothetical protein
MKARGLFATATATLLALASAADARADVPVRLRFNGYVDVPVAAGFSLIYAVSELGVKARLAPRAPYWDDRDASGEDILAPLDRLATRLRWERPHLAGRISDVGLGLSMVSALGLDVAVGAHDHDTPAHLAENTTIVLEAMATAMTMNQITKFFAGRQRPCAHFGLDQARPCFSDGSDNNLSSFSGHATFTSSLAVASGMVASMRRYRLAPLVWTSGALISLSTGYLRLAADKHYLSDVVTGMVIGSTIGFFVPYLFHGPRVPGEVAASPATGQTAAALRAEPLFAFSGTW